MTSANTSSGSHSGKVQRIVVLALGVIMCLLLFFADKSNLTNSSEAAIGDNEVSQPSNPSVSTNSPVPPLASEPKVDAWIAELETKSGNEKLALLDSISNNLEQRKRYAFAADYAARSLEIDPSISRKLRVGKLSYLASQLDYVQKDTSFFRRFSDQSIAALKDVIQDNDQNEEALLYLGLAYTRSGKVENSMNGIMTLRRLLEINPDNVDGSFHMGLFSMQTGQFEKAVLRFEKVLSLDPENDPARFQLAVAYTESGQAEKAKPLLDAVIKGKATPELKRSARELMNNLP